MKKATTDTVTEELSLREPSQNFSATVGRDDFEFPEPETSFSPISTATKITSTVQSKIQVDWLVGFKPGTYDCNCTWFSLLLEASWADLSPNP